VGSLLGDGHLMRSTAGFCFRAHHGVAQICYVRWKYAFLRSFVRTAPRISGSGCYFRTITHPALSELADDFYSDGKKIVPVRRLERAFTTLSFAVWLMDDGAADGRQTRLNTQCFSHADVSGLSGFLRHRFGIHTTINSDKGRPRLRIANRSMRLLRGLLLPQVLPQFRYKLGAQ